MSNFYDLEGLNQGYEGGVVALTINELSALNSLNARVRLDKIFTEEDGKLVDYLHQKYQGISEPVYKRKEEAFDKLCENSWQSHEDRKEFEVIVITECSMGIETREESRTLYQTRAEANAVKDQYKDYRRTYAVVSERIKDQKDE